MPRHPNSSPWKQWEISLLTLFLLSRTWILIARFGQSWGFDTGAHLWMLQLLRWKEPVVGIHESFYSYHPPFGFLLPQSLMLLGLSDIVSVQLVSFIASLVAFFFLRSTLKYLNLLWHPVSIAFLYITSSLPLQVYLSSSINLDVQILAYATMVLYVSIRLFWPAPTKGCGCKPKTRLTLALIATLAFAMLTKFNGIVLLAIPVLAALFAPVQTKNFFARLASATLLSSLALLLVFPYYFNRYYTAEGVFLPSNTDGWIEEYRGERDRDRFTFITNQLFAPLVHAEGTELEDFNFEGIRLLETWNGLWARTTWYRAQSPFSVLVSIFYQGVMPFLLFGGFVLMCHHRKHRPQSWVRLSVVLMLFSSLVLLSSLYFAYTHPYGKWHPAKTIYASGIVFGIGILLAHLLYTPRLQRGMLALIAAFMIVNHWIPVY